MSCKQKKAISVFGLAATVVIALVIAGNAHAAAIDVLVGDKNGFGLGCSDTGSCAGLSSPPIDNRTAGEIAAANGAQFTDVYSALCPGCGPNTVSAGDILLPFSGTLLSGTLSFAAGDFQSDVFGSFSANINGTSVPFSFPDGRFVTAIHSFTLTAGELAAANAAGQVDLHLDRGSSGDWVSFDWFELTGTTTSAVPEPGSISLLGIALGALAFTQRLVNRGSGHFRE